MMLHIVNLFMVSIVGQQSEIMAQHWHPPVHSNPWPGVEPWPCMQILTFVVTVLIFWINHIYLGMNLSFNVDTIVINGRYIYPNLQLRLFTAACTYSFLI